MKAGIFPNPTVALEVMIVFVVTTTIFAGAIVLSSMTSDDWYLNHLNGAISAVLAALIAHRLYLGVDNLGARVGWAFAFVIVCILALTQWFDGYTEALEQTLHIEDLDDLCLWLVMPGALLVAARFERIGRLPLQILVGGFLAQTASTWLDVMDGWLTTKGYDFAFVEVLVDFSEFVFLQLYLIGLTVYMASIYARHWPTQPGYPSGLSGHARQFVAGEMRYQFWRLHNPGRSHADFYAERITRRLDSGRRHATLGVKERVRPLTSSRGSVGQELPQWERGAGTFGFLKSLGLRADERCVDYGCGSLRIGMHFIRFLDDAHYWGVDITSRFFLEGKGSIDPRLLEAKRPRLDVISDESLERIREWKPDAVFSVSVLMHVHPSEVGMYLGNVIGLLSGGARAVILFDQTERNAKTASMSWTYSEGFLCEHLRRIDPGLDVTFRYFEPAGFVAGRPITRIAMTIARPKPLD